MSEECIKCRHCGYNGSELMVVGCNCTYHTTCFAVSPVFRERLGFYTDGNINHGHGSLCQYCERKGGTDRVYLIPLNIDHVLSTAALEDECEVTNQQSTLSDIASILSFSTALDSSNTGLEEVDLRNGRWTHEETQLVDELINLFEKGSLPLPKALTLNDFLRNFLLCKSTRLRKKMKNANFCTRMYQCNIDILGNIDPVPFSKLCDDFLFAVESDKERSMLRLAMQALWGSHFLDFCAQQDLTFLDAQDWLSALEKIEQRCVASREVLKQKERRKRLCNVVPLNNTANDFDSLQQITTHARDHGDTPSCRSVVAYDTTLKRNKDMRPIVELADFCGNFADWSPFLERVSVYVKSENLPFQYIDVWIAENNNDSSTSDDSTHKEKRARCTTVQLRNVGHAIRSDIDSIMTLYHMNEFGKYSSSFVFPSGVGLPGRVYETNTPIFDGSLQKANRFNFPRAIGARTHGIEVGLGLPIQCSYGRVILVLYSVDKLTQDLNLTHRLLSDLQLFQPQPLWTVMVDALPYVKNGRILNGSNSDQGAFEIYDQLDPEEEDLVNLIGHHLSGQSSDSIPFHLIPSATALRFLLLKNPSQRSLKDVKLIELLKKSHRSYLSLGMKTAFERLKILLNDWVFLKSESDEIPTTTRIVGTSSAMIDDQTSSLTDASDDDGFCIPFMDDNDIITSEILELVDFE